MAITLTGCQTLSLFNAEKRDQKKLQKIKLRSPQLFAEQIDTIKQIDTVTKVILIPEKRIDTAFEWKNGEDAWEWSINDTPDDPNTYTWEDFAWLVDDTKELRDSTGKLEATLDVKLNKNRLRTDLKVIHRIDTVIDTRIDTITKTINTQTHKTGTVTKTPWYLYALIGALLITVIFLLLRKSKKE